MDKELLKKQLDVAIAQKALQVLQHERSRAQQAARIAKLQADIAKIEADELAAQE
jgi:hypothetical protein